MKNIIITGGSSGFELLTVKTLASKGHSVYATMRNINSVNAEVASQLKNWALENHTKVEIVELDVTNDDSVNRALKKIANQTDGNIDVLINNAGLSYIGLSETLTAAQTNQMFQVNVIGTDRMVKAVLPFMHSKKEGFIINLSSALARNQIPVITTYNATKAAVDALSVGYYYELRNSGIEVAIVQPGGYPTTDIVTKGLKPGYPEAEASYAPDMAKVKATLQYIFTPKPESPDPQEVADLILRLIDLPKGEKPLWNVIGAGTNTAAIEEINQHIKNLVENSLTKMGIL